MGKQFGLKHWLRNYSQMVKFPIRERIFIFT